MEVEVVELMLGVRGVCACVQAPQQEILLVC